MLQRDVKIVIMELVEYACWQTLPTGRNLVRLCSFGEWQIVRARVVTGAELVSYQKKI